MRYFILCFTVLFSLCIQAQVKLPSSPTQIVVDSKDNLIVHCYLGKLIKIAPDGTATVITDDIRKGITKNPYPKCEAMTIDSADNLYITDDETIWIMPKGQGIKHFIGEPYLAKRTDGGVGKASFRGINYLKAAPDGSIYVIERDNTNKDNLGDYYVIRKIDANRTASTITDTRTNTALKTKWIAGAAVDSASNLYLSDGAGRCIKKLAKDGTITTLAGMCGKREFLPFYIQGDISKAELMAPEDIVITKNKEVVFADARLNRIIKIANNKVATVAGNSEIQPNNVNIGGRSKEGYKDGKAATALFNFPLRVRIAIDSKQNIYIIDGGNDCIRKLTPDGMVTTVAKKII